MTPDSGAAAGSPAHPGQATSADLASLQGLEDVDVAEHVGRFEAVHDALRARLDGESSPEHPAER